VAIASGGNITNTSGNLVTFTDTIYQAAGGDFSVLGNSSMSFQTITAAGDFTATDGTSGDGSTRTVTLGGSADNGFMGLVVNSGTVDLSKASTGSVHAVEDMTLNGGTVQMDGAPASGTLDQQFFFGGTETINGGTLDLNGRNEELYNIAGSGGTITNTASSTVATLSVGSGTYNGNISDGTGQIAVSMIGNGTIANLNASNVFSGGITVVSTGTLSMSGNNSLGSGNITVSSGTLALTGNNSGSGAITVAGGNLTTGLQDASAGGLNTFTGNITIQAGTLVANAAQYTNPLGSGSITIGDSGTTGLAATLVLNPAGGTATLSNPISVVGNGTNTINASNWTGAFTGNITLSNSNVTLITAQINNNGTGSTGDFYGNISGSGNVTLQENWSGTNGTFNLGSSASTSINNTGSLTNSGSSSTGVTINATIGANVTAVVQNSATSALTLSASNSFTGGLAILAGTVNETNGGDNSLGTGTITLGNSANTGQAATLVTTSGSSTFANPVTVTGNGTDTIEVTSYNPTYTGNISLANNLVLISNNDQNSTLTASGNVSGTGNLTLKVMGSNTGSAVVLSGASINNAGTITNNGNSSVATTATISGNLGGSVTALIENSKNSALSVTGNITLSNTLALTNKAGTLTVSGATSGSGNLTNNGAGSGGTTITGNISGSVGVIENSSNGPLNLYGQNTYTSPTIVSAGTLNAEVASVPNVSGAFGNNSAVVLANVAGATVNLNSQNTQIGSITPSFALRSAEKYFSAGFPPRRQRQRG
jgi:fibronectin-binding autotransporter adhesin